jgi:hypothetical protein
MSRPVMRFANKEFARFKVGPAFTKKEGIEVPTTDEATTGNRYVAYLVTCKTCGKSEKKTKQAIASDSVCSACSTVHDGTNQAKQSTKASLTTFLAGTELVQFRLNRQDAEAEFAANLDYVEQRRKWRNGGSIVFTAEADLLRGPVTRPVLFEQNNLTVAAPKLKTLGGVPVYVHENVDAETRAAYEAELTQPIAYPEPSGQPLGEVFTTTVTLSKLEKHANYFDNLNALADAIGLRPPAPNQRSGWLASASTRNLILAGRAPAAYMDATTSFESVATYPVNDIEEVWYYLYEYAPSSPDDIPDF